MTRLLLLSLVLLGASQPVLAAEWRRVGWFRSDSRNVSVGDTVVRVVSAVDTERLKLTGIDYAADSAVLERFYPKWDYRSDLVVYYGRTPEGFGQSRFEYVTGADRTPLPGDTISASLGIYDRAGTRLAKLSGSLAKQLGDTARVVMARSFNWDEDAEPEWLVITSGPAQATGKARAQSIRFYNRVGEAWQVERTYELRDPVFTGPLEVRDVTGDGKQDVIYRCFLETPGHFWVDAHIFSRHEGYTARTSPAVFQPEESIGPLSR